MAVIGKIRKRSGLLVIVIGVALAAFVLGDISKTQSRGQSNIGEVNGDEISYKEFSLEAEQNIEYQKQVQQKQSLTAIESFYVREQTWNQIVNEKILTEEIENLGIAVSVDELAELLHGPNPHFMVRQNFTDPQTGVFNPTRVKEILRTLDQMPLEQRVRYYNFEQSLILDQLNTKYRNLISKAYYVPESLAQKIASNNVLTAKVELLAKEISSIDDAEIDVTDSDLQKYYNEHIEDYKLEEERRAVDYVVFEVVPSVSDRTETTEIVNEIYQEFLVAEDAETFVNTVSDHRYDSTYYKAADLPIQLAQALENANTGTFVEPYLDNDVYYMAKLIDKQFRPDSMLASHILLSYSGSRNNSATRTREEAKNLADSLFVALNRAPSKFPALASQFSDDPSAKLNAGNLDWFADGMMVNEFNKAIIDANVGEIVMTETDFGYHIIEVNGKKDISRKYRIAIIDRAIEASGQTFQDYWTMASKFAAENTTYEAFTNAAPEFGLSIRSFEEMTRMTNQIYDLKYPRQMVRWAFNDDSGVGSISPIFDFDGKYIIAIVTDIEEEGYRSFDKVKDLLTVAVSNEKKLEAIEKQISGVKSFDAIAEKWDVKVEELEVNFNTAALSSHGRESKVTGDIFGLQKGEIATVVGDRGVYTIKLIDIKEGQVSVDLNRFKSQLASSFNNRIYQNAVIRALTGVSEIEDNRHLFY